MLTIERTQDHRLIREIMTHPLVYPWISDDGSPTREEWIPQESDAIWYLLVRDGPKVLGFWSLFPRNYIEYEVHSCLLPGHGYRRGRAAAYAAIDWAWQHTPARRLIASVPAYNRIAYTFARDVGFEYIGCDDKSFLRGGRLYDQALLGISKEK